MLAALPLVLLFGSSCAAEPDFEQACADECACTQDAEACSDTCDNRYRRTWVLADEESEACRSAYEAYFQCLLDKSDCEDDGGFPMWAPPDGACDALEDAHFDCGG
jgi:hypothetical protein